MPPTDQPFPQVTCATRMPQAGLLGARHATMYLRKKMMMMSLSRCKRQMMRLAIFGVFSMFVLCIHHVVDAPCTLSSRLPVFVT